MSVHFRDYFSSHLADGRGKEARRKYSIRLPQPINKTFECRFVFIQASFSKWIEMEKFISSID